MCVFYKRLDRGTFRLPTAIDSTTRVAITEPECARRTNVTA